MGIHKLTDKGIEHFEYKPVSSEEEIEIHLENHPELLDKDLYIIGRQVKTDSGKIIDLLGLDTTGNVIVIELKRHQTSRDVVSQILEYGVWAQEQNMETLNEIAKKNGKLGKHSTLWEKFQSETGNVPQFNENQRWYIVAEKIDNATKKVALYLREKDVDINCIEFQSHKNNGETIIHTNLIVGDEESLSSVEDEHEEVDWDYYIEKLGWHKDQIETIKSYAKDFEDFARLKGYDVRIALNKNYIAFQDSKANRNYLNLKIKHKKIRLEVRIRDEIKKYEPTLNWEWHDIKKLWRVNLETNHLPSIKIFDRLFERIHEGK